MLTRIARAPLVTV